MEVVQIVQQENHELESQLWAHLLEIADPATRQVLKGERMLSRFVAEDGSRSLEATRNPTGFGLAFLTATCGLMAAVNADMERPEGPERIVGYLQEYAVVHTYEDPEFDKAYCAWLNLSAYQSGTDEPGSLEYDRIRGEALLVLHEAREKEATP